MLRISKLTDYATLIMSFLALTPSGIFSAAAIAKAVHLSLPTASKILKILLGAHLVCSFRGVSGGYQIARPAAEINLAQIVAALEGKIAVTECCINNSACILDSLCSLKENWQWVNSMILKKLTEITLDQMLKPNIRLKGIPIVAG